MMRRDLRRTTWASVGKLALYGDLGIGRVDASADRFTLLAGLLRVRRNCGCVRRKQNRYGAERRRVHPSPQNSDTRRLLT